MRVEFSDAYSYRNAKTTDRYPVLKIPNSTLGQCLGVLRDSGPIRKNGCDIGWDTAKELMYSRGSSL